MGKPQVSIVSVSYNQEKYIRETLDSFLMQQTDFDFEIIVADDCSTDSTPQIIEEYARAHPKLFKTILRKENVGVAENFYGALRAAGGAYIALCEGDDYWTDPKKLQKQYDFLVKRPDYALCFHPVQVFFDGNEAAEYIYPDPRANQDFSLEELLKNNFIQTNSVMYRKQSYVDMPTGILPVDWFLHLYHAQFGKIGFIDQVMSAYRRHKGGVWWESHDNMDGLWKKHGVAYLGVAIALLKIYEKNERHRETLNRLIDDRFNMLIAVDAKHKTNLLQDALLRFPENARTFIIRQRREIEKDTLALQARQQDVINLTTDLRHMLHRKEERDRAVRHIETEYHKVLDSASWKVTMPLRKGSSFGRKSIRTAKKIPKRVKEKTSLYQDNRGYSKLSLIAKHIRRQPATKLAVVVHLFYVDTWPLISEKLERLEAQTPFDLFITMPKDQVQFEREIHKRYKHATILIVPNRGRDVLPFIKVALMLQDAGYQYFLKIHSKRSPHRSDGADWFSSILDNLIPAKNELLRDAVQTLNSPETAIIGPAGQYVSLSVNYPANKISLGRVIRELVSPAAWASLETSVGEYGFVAGTMFWGRFDAIESILRQGYSSSNFESEHGQIDGTFAHALERALCVVPELQGLKLYQLSDRGTEPIAYSSGSIPDWSGIYVGPKTEPKS